MDLKELKTKILKNSIDNKMLIFVDKDRFISSQYINEIAKIKNKKINYVENIIDTDNDFFDYSDDSCIKVLITDKFDNKLNINNYYVVCDSVADDIDKDMVIDVPKLENWQIQDYVYERCKGVSKQNLDKLLSISMYNVYRLENEINKITLFPEKSRNYIFEQFLQDGIFSDLTNYNIFNLSNALITKDISSIADIFKNIDNMDINIIGFISILYNNFKNIINIQLNPKATAESLDMNSKQFLAIKYRINHYSRNQLISIFNMLSDIDYKIKSGYINIENIIDYVTLKILSF